MNYPEMESVELASRTVLDGKYFVKEWPLKYENDQSVRLIYRVMPSSNHLESEFFRDFPFGELLVLPVNSAIDELKEAAERAFRDTYCVMDCSK